MIGLQALQCRVGGALDCFRRKILWDLALPAATRFTVPDEIISDLGRDRDLVALFRECLGDQFLAQSVAVSVSCIEKGNSEIERHVHERDCFALGEISPPAGRDRPETESDLADFKIGVRVSAKLHRGINLANSAENVQRRTLNIEWQ